MPGPVNMLDGAGNRVVVEEQDVPGALAAGLHIEGSAEQAGAIGQQVREERYGGPGGTAAALGAGVLRGASLGGSDALLGALGGREDLAGLRDVNPGLSIGGEIAGAILPTVLSAGASLPASAAEEGASIGARLLARTPAALAADVGRAGAALGEGAGALGRIGAAALGGAAEGALYGAGQGVSELALSQDPLTFEHAASVIGSSALFGAATGGVAGGAVKGVELGLARAKGALDEVLARGQVSSEIAQAAPDLATLDKRGLDAARKAELEAIDAARQPERDAFVQSLRDARDATYESGPWKAVKGSKNRFVRESSKGAEKGDLMLRKLLDNEVGLAQEPERVLNALQTQRQGYERVLDAAEHDYQAFLRSFQDAPFQIRNDILDGAVKGEIGPFTPQGLDLAVEREMLRRFGSTEAPVIPERFNLIDDVRATLARNEELQTRLGKLLAEPASPRLSLIDSALEAIARPKQPSVAEALVRAIPFTGPLQAAIDVSRKAVGGFRAAVGGAAKRAGEAVSSFLDVSSKAAGKAAPVAPIAATKVLGAVRYADHHPEVAATTRATKRTLAQLYKARTDEIKTQTAYDETGGRRMRPEARAAMGERLKALRAAEPIVADRIETLAVRRIEYLSSIIPRRPDMGIQTGPDRWQPSDMEMSSFARSVAAVEDPQGVLERAAAGAVTPEDAAALRAVYPELLGDFTARVAAELPTRQRTLPYARRLALSILTGLPVDPALDPAILSVLQAQYQYTPESAQPPMPRAQFGSVKSTELGTPSQRREEGTAPR